MWIQYSTFIILFFFLVILQMGLLVYIPVLASLNLIFIAFFTILFFHLGENNNPKELFIPFFAGFFLDVLYFDYFGVSIISMIVLYVLFVFLKKQIQNNHSEHLFVYFALLFLLCFVVYQLVSSFFLGFSKNAVGGMSVKTLYNLAGASVVFLLYRATNAISRKRQLPLGI